MAIHRAGDFSDMLAKLSDAQVGNFPIPVPAEMLLFPQHGIAAAFDRMGNIGAAIRPLPRIGREGDAGRDFPAVRRKPRNPSSKPR